MPKKTFSLSPEGKTLWHQIWVTKGCRTESGALERILQELDEALRPRLDAEALEQYRRCELNRPALLEAFARYRARKAGNGEKQIPVLAS